MRGYRLRLVNESTLTAATLLLFELWRVPALESYFSNPDHGFQLGLGRQILLGRRAFVDVFFNYGPLVPYTSAFGLWMWDSLIPETLICAAGYATAAYLIYAMVRQYSSAAAAWIAAASSLMFQTRFYKWYYWLFPLLVLYCLQKTTRARMPARHWALAAGLASAVGFLFRADLGLACGLCSVVILLLQRHARGLFAFAAGFLIPIGCWVGALELLGGNAALRDYGAAMIDGASGVVREWSLPLPRFDLRDPLSQESRAAVAFAMPPFAYFGCAVLGWREYLGTSALRAITRVLLAAALLGAALYPQALHRSDAAHLLSIIPPFLVITPLLLAELWGERTVPSSRRAVASRGVAVVYIALTAVAASSIGAAAAADLAPLRSNPLARYRMLAAAMHSNLNHPTVQIAEAIVENSGTTESILVAGIADQVYWLTPRRMSGLLNGYSLFILYSDAWRQRNLAAINADPPAVVMIRSDFSVAPADDLLRRLTPELYEFISRNYRRVVYDRDGWVLLKR